MVKIIHLKIKLNQQKMTVINKFYNKNKKNEK